MIKWLIGQAKKIGNFFKKIGGFFAWLFSYKSNEKTQPSQQGGSSTKNIDEELARAIKKNDAVDIKELITAAKKDDAAGIKAAEKLLENHVKNLSDKDLITILHSHRKNFTKDKIDQFLKNGDSSIYDLALKSSKNALTLLETRLGQQMSAIELANVAYKHRHNEDFIKAVREEKPRIPNLLLIVKKSLNEGTYKQVTNILSQSATLLLLYYLELKRQASHHPQVPSALPDINPYEILGIDRNANEEQIKKAYRKKALLVHPDKIQTQEGNRFKAANEAYEILIDPVKRQQWDQAHPKEVQQPITSENHSIRMK